MGIPTKGVILWIYNLLANLVHFWGVPPIHRAIHSAEQSSVDQISIWRYHFTTTLGARDFFSLWGRRIERRSRESVTSTPRSLRFWLLVSEKTSGIQAILQQWHFLDLANQCNKFISNIKPSPSYTKFKLTLYQMSIFVGISVNFFAICFQNGCSQVKWNVRKYLNAPHISVYIRKTNSWYGNRLKRNIFKE